MCNKCNHEHHEEETCYLPVIQQNTDDVFFGTSIDDSLPNLNLKAGVDLTSVLKKIDYKLTDIPNTANYGAFNLAFLNSKYTVNTVKTFSESVSLELGYNNTRVNQLLTVTGQQGVSLIALTNKVEDIRLPEILDNSGVGFTINDDINTVLQKIVNKFNNLTFTSPLVNLSSTDTSSVDITLTGSNNTNIRASVKKSNLPNNRLEILTDGLYVANTTTNSNQTLAINGNRLSISDGNEVTIPVSGLQSLSLTGNRLIISGSNYVDLPALTETILTANNSNTVNILLSGTSNHVITANVKISSFAGNILTNNSDGLFVNTKADEVLSQINASSSLKTTLCSIVSNCTSSICYKWHLRNTSSTDVVVSYINSSSAVTTTTIAANATTEFSGRSISTSPSSTLIITFIGIGTC